MLYYVLILLRWAKNISLALAIVVRLMVIADNIIRMVRHRSSTRAAA